MGIRRHLAPLLWNDRRKIELPNLLLFSMPGTPVVHYGDEIGMGDNYDLGDRDGVRMPMQRSADRNAGFSCASPQQLYLPKLQDPVHGDEAVNVEALLDRRDALKGRLEAAEKTSPSGAQCRIHGDCHLGQVLVVQTDVMIIDFEGEPTRSLEDRTAKHPAVRDVAGMLRSFDDALRTTVRRRLERGADPERTLAGVDGWRQATRGAFLDGCRATMDGAAVDPADAGAEWALLDLHLIQKAACEVGYEMAMRPDWVDIPLRSLLALMEDES